jgi:diacylglycerol kinase family enzyme
VVRPPQLVAEAGGREVTGVSAFVQNGDPYTYFRNRPVELVDGVELASGRLGAAVLERASAVDIPTVLWRALSTRARIERHRRVSVFHDVDRLTVRSADDRGIPLQVDGDYVGEATEAEFTVLPGALRVVA